MSARPELLSARDFRVRRGGAVTLDLAELCLAEGEILALIGPNGAGKSTLLLCLAGIEPPDGGDLRFRGEPVRGAAATLAYRRRIAMAFQEPLLFDTTVLGNVASGLKLRGLPQEETRRRCGESLERFRVSHLADRAARTLSGGEAQRVSLARALALAPEVLLLDEPFAALDPPTRAALLDDLGRTLRETRTTTVFATHELRETARLADRIGVIDGGRLRRIGETAEILGCADDPFIASFLG